ncbi:oxidation resistance protein 1 isoform X9 [Octopus sinensis]|uniref:Oxidation resistance protein 1 n=1 Tax=Octopus sinensis TaxID=2607531 RepID=A0A7E6FPN3_9MOLL|nr:oxidation resistance protein 1 isoform X9 [Octopus sinensis]
MSCRIICPGQVLYVPGPDYDVINNTLEPSSPTAINIPENDSPKLDVSLSEKSVSKVPGHAERLSPKEVVEINDPARRISEEEARKLDEECVSRFLKFDAKHITDGQGVVNGTLIVTPNAIMFDPSVHDPLVIEHGNDKYGMVAAMETIISAAIYRDLKTMKIKGQVPSSHYPATSCPGQSALQSEGKALYCQQRDSENSEVPKAEVYCGQGHFKFATSKQENESDYLETSNKLVKIMQAVQSSQCDSKEQQQQQQQPQQTTASLTTTAMTTTVTTTTTTPTIPPTADNVMKQGVGNGTLPGTEDKTMERLPNVEGDLNRLSLETADHQSNGIGRDAGDSLPEHTTDATVKQAEMQNDQVEESDKDLHHRPSSSPSAASEAPLVLQPPRKPHKIVTDETHGTEVDNEADSNVDDQTSKETPELNSTSAQPKLSPKDPTITSSMMEGSPKLKAIYNYAAGFFQSSGSAEKTTPGAEGTPESPVPSTGVPSQQGSDNLSTSPTSPRTPGVEYTTKRGTRVRVVSAVTMEDTPNLFQPVTKDDELKASLLTIRYEEPPLFLCLKVGKPKNTTVTYEAPFSTYGKAKKPEYWFTVSQEKADNFYAFLLHWKPEIYGDDEETEARKLGFVIFDNSSNQAEDDLDILDGYFGHRESISKDWEIVTSDEDYRKKSLEVDDTPVLPEFIGETHILTEEQITTLVEHLPGRTVGYSWILIYSTDLHGFSLKTLYRDMTNYESPVLLTVRNTQSQVFGALISCPLKVSDHFYGTGESFLFTFHPKFRIFRWTGENNFFVKGNQESLVIGAGKGFFGLWFDGDLYHGRSHPCDTFGNDVLCEEEDFVVQAFEAWGFV